jgi:hypothetical protein
MFPSIILKINDILEKISTQKRKMALRQLNHFVENNNVGYSICNTGQVVITLRWENDVVYHHF